jgi:hypothetical protein
MPKLSTSIQHSKFSIRNSAFTYFSYVSLLVVLVDELDVEVDVSVFVLDSDFSPPSFFFSPPDPEEVVEPASVEDFLA